MTADSVPLHFLQMPIARSTSSRAPTAAAFKSDGSATGKTTAETIPTRATTARKLLAHPTTISTVATTLASQTNGNATETSTAPTELTKR